ncbi:Putative prolin-rich extensin-like receptor protein kinase family protein [Zea mays]|uniref:Putative prolin-rich extensin-like receptor protein kinase family protein n=1 Tax=Zea mays TaxID=4577 RepID=A0A1D6GBK8_MAIZE|nr:Putative prolin-rich extensin-like receptor protein kinase family protein [Zea mays]
MGPLRTRVLGRGTSVSFSCDPLVLYIASCVWGLQPRLVWALPIKGPIKGTIVGLSPIQSLLTGCRGHTQHSALSCLIAPGTRRVLRPAASDDAAAEPFAGAGHHGRHVRVRRPSGGDGQVLGREPTRAGRVRARVPRHGGRAGGGHQEAAGRRRAGRPRVPRRGGDHQPRAPQEPRLPRRLLPLRRAAAARVRVRAQQDPRVPSPRDREWQADAGLAEAVEDRGWLREGPRVPARRLLSKDHPS